MRYNYKFALDNGGVISPTNANEVETIQDLTSSVTSTSRGIADGLGRGVQNQVVDESYVILQNTEYNELSQVDLMTKPLRVISNKQSKLDKSNPIDKILVKIGLKDIFSEGVNNYVLLGDNKAEGVVYSEVDYEPNPLARVSKFYPLGKDATKDSNLFIESRYGSEIFGGKQHLYTQVIDEEGNDIFTFVDQFGNTRKSIDSRDTVAVFDYDGLGRLTEANIDDSNPENPVGDGIRTTNTYDAYGRKNQTCFPDSGCTNYTFDNNGNVLTVIDARGWVTRFEYDNLDRLSNLYLDKGAGENKIIENTYDSGCNGAGTQVGKLCVVERYNDYGEMIYSAQYGYDTSGRTTYVSAYSDVFGVDLTDPITYQYDYAGNLYRVLPEENDEVLVYEYNHLNQLKRVILDPSGEEIQLAEFEYNPGGTLDQTTYGNEVVAGYQYNSRDWLKNITIGDIFYERYEYNDVGNLDRMYDSQDLLSYVDFEYDELYRLTDVIDYGYYDESPVDFTLDQIGYEYDNMGNREFRSLDGDAVDYTYDYSCDPQEYCYGMRTSRLRTTSEPSCEYHYDYVGNNIWKDCVDEGKTFYHYDYNNLIARIDLPDGNYLKFLYDAEGRRIAKTDGQGNLVIYQYGLGSNPLRTIETTVENPEEVGEGNLLLNPSFEADFGMDYYENEDGDDRIASNLISDGWDFREGSAEMDSTIAQGGEFSVKITNLRTGFASQKVPIDKSKTYKASGWMKVNAACADNDNCEAVLGLFCSDGVVSEWDCPIDSSDWPSVSDRTTWTYVETEPFTFDESTLPGIGPTYLEVGCYNSPVGVLGLGTVWCDSFKLEEVSTSPPVSGDGICEVDKGETCASEFDDCKYHRADCDSDEVCAWGITGPRGCQISTRTDIPAICNCRGDACSTYGLAGIPPNNRFSNCDVEHCRDEQPTSCALQMYVDLVDA